MNNEEKKARGCWLCEQSGLTDEQHERLDAIREQMSALDQEARQIVNPSDEEIQGTYAMYADDYGRGAAELLGDTWGVWEDWLSQRSSVYEDHKEHTEMVDVDGQRLYDQWCPLCAKEKAQAKGDELDPICDNCDRPASEHSGGADDFSHCPTPKQQEGAA